MKGSGTGFFFEHNVSTLLNTGLEGQRMMLFTIA
jgi:hypothetical protein